MADLTALPTPARRDAVGHSPHPHAFARLCVAHASGTVGQLLVSLAVGVHVLHETASPTWGSATVALGFLPYVLLSPVAGAVADRHARGRVVAVSCLARALLAMLLAAGLLAGWSVPVLVLTAFALGAAGTPSYPAVAAATPDLVPDGRLLGANALVTCVENASWVAGPGIFSLLVLAGRGPATVCAVAGVMLLAAAATAAVRTPPPRGASSSSSSSASSSSSSSSSDATPTAPEPFWHALRDGVRLLGRARRARRPMALACVDNFLYGYLVVAFVLIAAGDSGTPGVAGWANPALTVGALGVMPVLSGLARRMSAEGLTDAALVVLALSVLLVALGGPGRGPTAGILLALVAMAGAASVVAEVGAVTLLQRSVPREALARVFGVYDQLNVGAIALGSMVAGPLAAALGPRTALAAVAAAGLLSTTAWGASGAGRGVLGSWPWRPIWSCSPPSTSRAAEPSSSSRGWPGRRRPSATPSRRR